MGVSDSHEQIDRPTPAPESSGEPWSSGSGPGASSSGAGSGVTSAIFAFFLVVTALFVVGSLKAFSASYLVQAEQRAEFTLLVTASLFAACFTGAMFGGRWMRALAIVLWFACCEYGLFVLSTLPDMVQYAAKAVLIVTAVLSLSFVALALWRSRQPHI